MVRTLERARPATADADFGVLVAGLVPPLFPSRDDVHAVAAVADARWGVTAPVPEGRHPFATLVFSPGTLAVRTGTRDTFAPGQDEAPDAAMVGLDAATSGVPVLRGWVQDGLIEEDELRAVRGEVTKWSKGSRRRMVRAIAELDLSAWPAEEGVLAMVTLTLPGLWQPYASTGKAFKELVRRFRKRWERHIGVWRCLWKLEFQRRGAPHEHLLMRIPAMVGEQRFEEWLSETWADVCLSSLDERTALAMIDLGEADRHISAGTGIDFSGVKFSDPRRTSIYFLKHSAKTMDDKEYQHIVPKEWRGEGYGPGRFWGVAGLARAAEEVEVSWDTMVRARRILRGVARGRAAAVAISRAAGEHGSGSPAFTAALVGMRATRARSLTTAGGWVLLGDGVAAGRQLLDALSRDAFPRPGRGAVPLPEGGFTQRDALGLDGDGRAAQRGPQVTGEQGSRGPHAVLGGDDLGGLLVGAAAGPAGRAEGVV